MSEHAAFREGYDAGQRDERIKMREIIRDYRNRGREVPMVWNACQFLLGEIDKRGPDDSVGDEI